jgi:FtsP/CotA-like multicopper oxidase with cupredoxin domain
MKQGREITVDIHNHSADAEIVHWHGLFLPVPVDGAMEEGSPMIRARRVHAHHVHARPGGLSLVPHAYFCGRRFAQGTVHGAAWIPDDRADSEAAACRVTTARSFWRCTTGAGARCRRRRLGDAGLRGATINGKMLGFGEPVRVKQGERVMMHVLNSSPTEVHWVALAGHTFRWSALDGNAVPQPRTVGCCGWRRRSACRRLWR